jgi:phospholipid/cholesterol/gamma-HCH transport system ATP-binding protein
VIRIQRLHKRFGRQPVLRGIDLDIATGEIMVVIGRSGGGKSVLLKHLIGLLRPDSGTVAVDGTEITRLRGGELDRVRARYGVVFQGGALFDSMSVAENVAFPLREKSRLRHAEIRERVEEKLEQVGLSDMGHKNPAEISGGMRKRVAIARALVTEPEIVFFDEPTTGLDPILVNTIHHLIVELHRKFRFTAVMVSHEIPEIFEIADRVAMLHEGVIVEVGPPEAVRASTNPIVQQFIRGDVERMKRSALDLSVGIFVLIGLLALGWLSVKLGRVDLLGSRGYVISADFPSVGGLKAGSTIEIAGVEIGRVDKILLQDYQARVVMVIQPGIKLQDDSIASIKTKGLIGERYVRISPGGSDKIIGPNGRIREVEPPVDIEELLSKYIFGKV